jgi:hypothetical protein
MYATPTKRRTPIWQLYSVRSTVCDFANHEDEERIFFSQQQQQQQQQQNKMA